MHTQFIMYLYYYIAKPYVIKLQWFERRFIIKGFHIIHSYVIITSITESFLSIEVSDNCAGGEQSPSHSASIQCQNVGVELLVGVAHSLGNNAGIA